MSIALIKVSNTVTSVLPATLYCSLNLFTVMKQTAMLKRATWQETKGCCNSLSRLPEQNTTIWVPYRTENCFLTVLETASLRSGCQHGWVRAVFWEAGLSLCAQVVDGRKRALFSKGTNPICWVPPLWPNHFPNTHPPDTICLWVGFNVEIVEDTNSQPVALHMGLSLWQGGTSHGLEGVIIYLCILCLWYNTRLWVGTPELGHFRALLFSITSCKHT